MRIFILFICYFIFAGCENSAEPLGFTDSSIEYRDGSGRYVIVVIKGEREMAYRRAAEKTRAEGGRFFLVVAEGDVQVVQSDKPWPDNQAFHQNMYQELIVEGDFDRERLLDRAVPAEQLVPGYRIVFQILEKKGEGKAIDACSLVECQE